MKSINKKTLLTIFHDFIVLLLSFIFAIWLRLEKEEIKLLLVFLDHKIWLYLIIFPVSTIYLFKRFGLYQGMWKYASIQEIISIFKGLTISSLFLLAILFITIRLEFIPRSFPILLFIVSILTISGPRILYRVIKDKIKSKGSIKKKIPVIIVGEDDTTELFIRAANREKTSPFLVIAIIGTKKKSIGRKKSATDIKFEHRASRGCASRMSSSQHHSNARYPLFAFWSLLVKSGKEGKVRKSQKVKVS